MAKLGRRQIKYIKLTFGNDVVQDVHQLLGAHFHVLLTRTHTDTESFAFTSTVTHSGSNFFVMKL